MPRSRTLPPSAAAVEESTVGDVTVLEYAEHALNHQKCALESAKSLASVLRTKVLGGHLVASLLKAFALPAQPVTAVVAVAATDTAAAVAAVDSTEAVIDLLREGDDVIALESDGLSRQLEELIKLTFTKSDGAEDSLCTQGRMLGSSEGAGDFTFLGDDEQLHPCAIRPLGHSAPSCAPHSVSRVPPAPPLPLAGRIETASHEVAQLIGGHGQLSPMQRVHLLAIVRRACTAPAPAPALSVCAVPHPTSLTRTPRRACR